MTGTIQVMLGIGFTPLNASVSPSSVSGSRATGGTCVSGTAAATGTGGSTPYTYAWTYVSGDSGISCNSSTASATTFQALVSSSIPSRTAVWRCTITDSLGATATADVSIDLEYTGGA